MCMKVESCTNSTLFGYIKQNGENHLKTIFFTLRLPLNEVFHMKSQNKNLLISTPNRSSITVCKHSF